MEFQNRSFRNRLKCIFGKSYRTARKNFQGENYKIFDLSLFRKETIQIVFDALHGIDNEKARDENLIMKYLIIITASSSRRIFDQTEMFFIPWT